MRFGTAVRALIVLAWLGLFGWHTVRHAAPMLGLGRQADVRDVVAAQLDRTLTWRLRWLRGRPRDLGECVVWIARDDTRFRVDHRLRLADLGPVIGPMIGAGGGGDLDLHLALVYDDRFRLVATDGYLALAGRTALDLTFSGVVDHRGLVVEYAQAGQPPATLVLPGVEREGVMLAPTLPAGLARGDRLAIPILDPRALLAGGSLRGSGALRVVDEELIETRGGTMGLLRVEIEAGGKVEATAWCDGEGTIYRLEAKALPIVAELVSIAAHGEPLWPRPEAR